MQLLAKEVKSLRQQLAEAAHRAEKAETEAVAAAAQVRPDSVSKREVEALERRLVEAVERAEVAESSAAKAVEGARAAEEACLAGQCQSAKSIAAAEARAKTATAQLASTRRKLQEEHAEALTNALADAEARRQSDVAAAADQARADALYRVTEAESRACNAVARLTSLEELRQRDSTSCSEAEGKGQGAADMERVTAEGAAGLRDAEARAADRDAFLGSLLEEQGRDVGARAEAGLREDRDQPQAAQQQANAASGRVQVAEGSGLRAEDSEARLSAAPAEWEQRIAELSVQLAQARAEALEAERRLEHLATEARGDTERVGLVQPDASKSTAREENSEALGTGRGQPSNTVAGGPSALQQALVDESQGDNLFRRSLALGPGSC